MRSKSSAVASSSKRQRIALFGGTFDPVHSGHLEVAQSAVKDLSLDRVIFLPCRQSPHKTEAAGASEEQRLAMLQMATEGIAWAEVSDWEFQQPVPSYSWRTAEAFAKRYPDAELFWLMGQDQWSVLASWSRADYLASLVAFIIHDRDGDRSREGEGAYFLSGNHPASSSAIREILAERGQVPEPWLADSVRRYLQKEGLYRE